MIEPNNNKIDIKVDLSKYETSIDDSCPLVSIIIPCYNDGEYILDALESALLQSYPSVEVIIVDDASHDSITISVLNKISHPRVKIYRNDENLHLSATRNRGISLSKGKYILPLDADDKIDKYYIQKTVEIMENDSSIGVVYCKANLFGLKSGLWYFPDFSIDDMLIDNIVFATALFRKDDWIKVGGYSEDLKAGLEDYDFWLSILETGKEIYQIQEVLFYYRIKEKSMTNDMISDLPTKKKTFQYIYSNHYGLYEKYKEKYLVKLRDVQLEMEFHNRNLENALAAANETINQLKKIEQSTFWRITKPARFAMDKLRKLYRIFKK